MHGHAAQNARSPRPPPRHRALSAMITGAQTEPHSTEGWRRRPAHTATHKAQQCTDNKSTHPSLLHKGLIQCRGKWLADTRICYSFRGKEDSKNWDNVRTRTQKQPKWMMRINYLGQRAHMTAAKLFSRLKITFNIYIVSLCFRIQATFNHTLINPFILYDLSTLSDSLWEETGEPRGNPLKHMIEPGSFLLRRDCANRCNTVLHKKQT